MLTALFQREKTGRGTLVQVSLLDSALAALANQATTFLVTGHDPRPLGSGHPSIVPYGTVYRAANGRQLVLAVGSDGQFQHLCAMHQPAWATDSRFTTNAARVAHRTELEVLLAARIAAVDGEELLAELERRAVPAGAVRTVGRSADAALGAGHAAARGRGPRGGLAYGRFSESGLGGGCSPVRTARTRGRRKFVVVLPISRHGQQPSVSSLTYLCFKHGKSLRLMLLSLSSPHSGTRRI